MRPRLSRRVLLVALIAAIAAVAARVAAPALERQARLSAPLACGVERWRVKTLQDRPRLLRPRPTTIAHLVRVPRPTSLPPTRLAFERRVFTVVAAVTLVRHEDDQNLHLVMFEPWYQLQPGRSRPRHMIAEAPSPACTTRATPYRRRQMRLARRAVKMCARARVTGVAFFDVLRGQTGVAPNAIELHPILGFACLSG